MGCGSFIPQNNPNKNIIIKNNPNKNTITKNDKRRKKYPLESDIEVPYLASYLETLSDVSQEQTRNIIHYCADYFKQHFNKELLEVDSGDILTFFKKDLDQRHIKKQSKRHWRYIMTSYYNYVRDYKLDIEKETFIIPMPSIRIFDFSGTVHTLDVFEEETNLLSLELIKKIIYYVYHTKPTRIFIALCLIIFSGARIREVLQIRLKKLNLKERWFITIVKSKKKDSREGLYFFPEFFRSYIENYIKLLSLEYTTPVFLFQNGGSHLTTNAIRKQLRQIKKALGLQAHINAHAYRGFLNEKRYEAGCRTPILEFLLNQTVKGVNPSSYMKKFKYRVKLRGLYDRYSPYSEAILPKVRL